MAEAISPLYPPLFRFISFNNFDPPTLRLLDFHPRKWLRLEKLKICKQSNTLKLYILGLISFSDTSFLAENPIFILF
jgi:hypothetical protein